MSFYFHHEANMVEARFGGWGAMPRRLVSGLIVFDQAFRRAQGERMKHDRETAKRKGARDQAAWLAKMREASGQ